MRTTRLMAAILVAAMAGAALSAARAQTVFTATAPNNTPLAFGMDVDQVSRVLGVTLNYVRGRPGNELFLALANVKGAALSDRNDGLYLQFRRGRLTGWKGDWRSNRPCWLLRMPLCAN
jgi:hypothetical protein